MTRCWRTRVHAASRRSNKSAILRPEIGRIGRAVADAMAMKTVKSTIVPWPELVG